MVVFGRGRVEVLCADQSSAGFQLDLAYDVFEMPGEPGLFICTYTADPGSESEEKLHLLASWAATQEEAATSGADGPATPHPHIYERDMSWIRATTSPAK